MIEATDRSGEPITMFRHEAVDLLERYDVARAVENSPTPDPGDLMKALNDIARDYGSMDGETLSKFWKEHSDQVWEAIDRPENRHHFREPSVLCRSDQPNPSFAAP
ncbi:hypothetical protein [Roseivivax sp. CAU 1761]